MKVTITPRKLSGTIQVPPSKSQAHRLIIGAALANGTSPPSASSCRWRWPWPAAACSEGGDG